MIPKNPWQWFAAAVLAVVALADGSLVVAARMTRPAAVEPRPWLASADLDRLKESRDHFAASGMRLSASEGATGRVVVSLEPAGSTIGASSVLLYRPDDAGLDRRIRWTDTSTALQLELPRGGMWRLHLESDDHRFAAEHILEKRP